MTYKNNMANELMIGEGKIIALAKFQYYYTAEGD